MFEEAGISEEPKTWADLENAASKLKNNNVTPFIVGGAAGDSWAAAWPLMDLVALNVTGKDDYNTYLHQIHVSPFYHSCYLNLREKK